ncbi:retron Se72 family effector protein [Pseudoalteromonas sp. M8]|uniref:retron Se72 family effector protein n=1 Tax=Pseudoalteromonas sp. M8 TaxID=2692624 RepID=UPI001BAB4C14|nr:retron Se72 family effector protein [Pseudoalteromonas sp. M8]QUI72261.1 cold shock domain-containing protein [Pseudoalteromonas sp. M8]
MTNEIEFGIVTTYDTFKGFGFIRRSKGKDVFFHYQDLAEKIKEPSPGDKLKFKVGKKPKGPYAYEISIIEVEE